MIGEPVVTRNENLWKYLAAREAEDSARRAASPATAMPRTPAVVVVSATGCVVHCHALRPEDVDAPDDEFGV